MTLFFFYVFFFVIEGVRDHLRTFTLLLLSSVINCLVADRYLNSIRKSWLIDQLCGRVYMGYSFIAGYGQSFKKVKIFRNKLSLIFFYLFFFFEGVRDHFRTFTMLFSLINHQLPWDWLLPKFDSKILIDTHSLRTGVYGKYALCSLWGVPDETETYEGYDGVIYQAQ